MITNSEKKCPFQQGDCDCGDWCPLWSEGSCAFTRIAAALEKMAGAETPKTSILDNVERQMINARKIIDRIAKLHD